MTTKLARRYGSWIIYAEVESLGTAAGLYKFATATPRYLDDSLWLPILGEVPPNLRESVSSRGGVRSAAPFEVALVDRDDFLTSLLRWDAPPETELSAAASISATTMVVYDRATYADGTLLWVGSECVVTIDDNGSGSYDVTRGALGTRPVAHRIDTPVRRYPPRLEGREVRLYMVPHDATDLSSERIEIAVGIVLRVGLEAHWSRWRLKCGSSSLGLKRTVGDLASLDWEIHGGVSNDSFIIKPSAGKHRGRALIPSFGANSLLPWHGVALAAGTGLGAFLIDRTEILLGSVSGFAESAVVTIHRRACAATRLARLEDGVKVRVPLYADPSDGAGAFFYSRIGAVDLDDIPNEWIADAHFLTLILGLMTSARTLNDGKYLTNFSAPHPNYSFLPAGWGAGIDHSTIDWDSVASIRARTKGWDLPQFVLAKPESLASLLSRDFLEPFGMYIGRRSGMIRFALYRAPHVRETATTIDTTNTLVERSGAPGEHVLEPPGEGEFDGQAVVRAIKISTRGTGGEAVDTVFTAADLHTALGEGEADDSSADEPLSFELRTIGADMLGPPLWFEMLALRLLFRAFNPPLVFPLWLDFGEQSFEPGDLASLTLDGVPNARTGARGWSSVLVLSLDRTLALSELARQGSAFGWHHTMLSFGSFRPTRLVGPCGKIDGWSAGAYTARLCENHYTATNADVLGHPVTDASAFEVGMRVWLLRASGSRASPQPEMGWPGYETIVSISGNVIELSGDFLGTDALGLILALAEYDEARTDERGDFLAFAAIDDGTLSGDDPATYGET